ncbi:IS5 family transposase [Thauera linaloolentis]|uniref:TIS1021-transposase n=1 Tax=Thauera linaloolentis (strain DSM 12138 / JCM 21573 / CCUG 41526 / CIP 105981 / IAM 15112 / NBRC 102519 / 47Lol) TaxID=1123367 RepID=N6YML3_THAL4|nr:IS5 family transposase [Thauera linaloolentis]ENO83607.1 TIS1021-transposase [Thauera linaloolentis 47Lol = DSM 12138]MCM8567725.1 IS5 family transposase [Thauera linaloolentis]
MKHRPQSPKQLSFASYEFAQKKRVTRREKFLGEMEQVVPWARLQALIEPKYPTAGRVGRQPVGVARMLRMYFLQQWFGLADEALEDAIYDSQSMREFVGIDLSRETVPDASTLLKFRRLLEEHALTARLFEGINAHLAERGLLLREGTMVDATIIAAPPSTKNKAHARDPEMHQSKKGNAWHFGMKAHIGADADSGLVHSLHTTAANESDVAHAHEVLHGQESQAFLDAGYTGVAKREEILQAQATGKIRSDIEWSVAKRRSTVTKMAEGTLKELTRALERVKAQLRARVEHPFHVLKNLFRYKKTRYKGLAKNEAQLYSLFGLANLVLAKKRLMALQGAGMSAP